jgi:regulator of RNase E activity RraA
MSDKLVERFKKLRTADVSDALDCLGFYDTYVMSQKMRPVWEGAWFAGRAYTVRLVPTNKSLPKMPKEEYFDTLSKLKAYDWSRSVDSYPDNTALVIDAGGTQAGLLGSANILRFTAQGVDGLVIDGTCRDSDEVRMEQIPVWCTMRSCSHVIGRLEESHIGEIIHCGGVRVAPGDIIVADSDAVVVVPQALAEEAAGIAEEVKKKDMVSRGKLYKALGRAADETVIMD